jgi:hypothetical protein
MRVTIESELSDEATIAEFWDMYQESFAPLATLAATKQTMSEDEFRALMVDETVLKFVGWDRNGDPAAVMIVATDLSAVSWINREYFETRWPEHAERGAIYYTMAALVRPTARGSLWFRAVLLELIKFSAVNRGVTALDCCRHNVENVQIPRIAKVLSASVADLEYHELDTQTYFAYEFHGLKEHLTRPRAIDLRPAIDLTDHATDQAAAEAAPTVPNGVTR